LASRTWARGVTTTYTYNDAGDLSALDYSDATPDVAYHYDRRGR
jgi:YD repeat-containing protein